MKLTLKGVVFSFLFFSFLFFSFLFYVHNEKMMVMMMEKKMLPRALVTSAKRWLRLLCRGLLPTPAC